MGRKNKAQKSERVPNEDRGNDMNEGLNFSSKKDKKQDINDREKKDKRQ